MATFLDVSILQGFSGIFTFLLVWVVSFGMLQMTAPFGKDKVGLYGLSALLLAILVLFTEAARTFVELLVPWLTVFAIGIFFMLFVFMAFGVDSSFIQSWVTADGGATNAWVMVIIVIIALFALGGALGKPAMEEAPQGEEIIYREGLQETALSPRGFNQPGYQGGAVQQEQASGTYGIDGRTAPQNTFWHKFTNTFIHPKVLGMFLVLLVGTFAISYLAKDS